MRMEESWEVQKCIGWPKDLELLGKDPVVGHVNSLQQIQCLGSGGAEGIHSPTKWEPKELRMEFSNPIS